jgi:hypothetical protein
MDASCVNLEMAGSDATGGASSGTNTPCGAYVLHQSSVSVSSELEFRNLNILLS